MKSPIQKIASGIARTFVCLCAMQLTAATVSRPAPQATGDELAVWRTVAEDIARENASRPYNLWYVVSDFAASTYLASAMADPDRDQYCGLSSAEAQAMLSELKAVNALPVALEASIAKNAGVRIAYTKDRRQRYFALSRVLFDAARERAWVSMELNGTRGAIVGLARVGGQWTKTSKCAGWYVPE
jgi:hypothetical protein